MILDFQFDAITAEKKIKSGSRAKKIALIESTNPSWKEEQMTSSSAVYSTIAIFIVEYRKGDSPRYSPCFTALDFLGQLGVSVPGLDQSDRVNQIQSGFCNRCASKLRLYASRLLKKTIAPSPFNYEVNYEYYPDGNLKHVKQQTPEGLYSIYYYLSGCQSPASV